jgi:hypothetical protein
MKRTLEPVDVIVLIGLCATLLGGGLFFIATNGATQVGIPEPVEPNEPTDIMTGMYWLQPVLGQAIVQQSVLERDGAAAIAAAATELNRATLVQDRLQRSPFGHFDAIKARAAAIPAEHAGRIQEVMGRSVVNFTQRGVRTGGLSAAQSTGGYNSAMIRLTEAWGKRMDDDFQANWQANLGRAIMTASRNRATMSAQAQERIGAAITQMARVQSMYEKAIEAARGQLTAAANAAIRTELRTDLFAQLAQAERIATSRSVPQAAPVVAPQSSSDSPFGYFTAIFTGLIVLFLGGLWCSSSKREEERSEETRPEGARRMDREAA